MGEATDMENASNSQPPNKLQVTKPLAKTQVKHPFKAVAATHVRLQKQMHVQS